MRRFFKSVAVGLATDTSHRFWAFLGVEWVVASGVSFALFIDSEGSPIRLAFYEVAVVLIPVLLGVFLRERRAELRSRAERHSRAQGRLRSAEADLDGVALVDLRERIAANQQLLTAATAFTAWVPAAALTGEAIALLVIATGSSTMFSYGAVLTATVFAALGAMNEMTRSFQRATTEQPGPSKS